MDGANVSQAERSGAVSARPTPLELQLAWPGERPYGALTDAGAEIGELLLEHVPALADGRIEIARIARLPGLMSKVAVRPTRRFTGGPQPVGLVVGAGAVHLQPIMDRLGDERIHIVRVRPAPEPYIADALWLSYRPNMRLDLTPDGRRYATVLLGEVDAIGAVGRQACNVRTASWLTDWRIRIRALPSTDEWQALKRAAESRAILPARAIERTSKGLIVEVARLRALLPFGRLQGIGRNSQAEVLDARVAEVLQKGTLEVRVQRLDSDFGRVYVVEAPPAARNLALPL